MRACTSRRTLFGVAMRLDGNLPVGAKGSSFLHRNGRSSKSAEKLRLGEVFLEWAWSPPLPVLAMNGPLTPRWTGKGVNRKREPENGQEPILRY
jgi:hypothetical protein